MIKKITKTTDEWMSEGESSDEQYITGGASNDWLMQVMKMVDVYVFSKNFLRLF